MKRNIVIVMNGKGGVGKSTFATNFVQYLKDRKIAHQAIDTDNENSTLKRFHRDAIYVDIEEPQEFDAVLATLEQKDLVVLDCRAASTDLMLEYVNEINGFTVLKEMGAMATVVIPVNHEADSVEQLRTISDGFGSSCRYLILKNQVHSDHFRIYDNSQIRKNLLGALGGMEMVMPKLYDWLVTLLNEFNLTITDAIVHPKISLMDRQRLKNWQVSFYERIDEVQTILLPSVPPKDSLPTKGEADGNSKGKPL